MRRSGVAFGVVILAVLTVLAGTVLAQQQPAQQQPTPQLPTFEVNVEVVGTAVADFTTKMDSYAALRRTLEQGLAPLRVTDRPAEIRRAEQLLAERLRRARAGAKRGDIFTEDIRRAFRRLLKPVTTPGTCEAIANDNPGEFAYRVNADYPKGKPLSTVPVSMLAVLPALPEDVWYRFLDTDLILHDSRANVILDRIDDAIDCDDD